MSEKAVDLCQLLLSPAPHLLSALRVSFFIRLPLFAPLVYPILEAYGELKCAWWCMWDCVCVCVHIAQIMTGILKTLMFLHVRLVLETVLWVRKISWNYLNPQWNNFQLNALNYLFALNYSHYEFSLCMRGFSHTAKNLTSKVNWWLTCSLS